MKLVANTADTKPFLSIGPRPATSEAVERSDLVDRARAEVQERSRIQV